MRTRSSVASCQRPRARAPVDPATCSRSPSPNAALPALPRPRAQALRGVPEVRTPPSCFTSRPRPDAARCGARGRVRPSSRPRRSRAVDQRSSRAEDLPPGRAPRAHRRPGPGSRSSPSRDCRGPAGRSPARSIVVGSALATLETNALFAARIRDRGAAAAEPRRFPYTSPNAVAGECSIAFGLTGPGFSVGGGLHAALEALGTAAVLVEGGDADRIVVVAVDDVGPATRALAGDSLRPGAVAVLLGSGMTEGSAHVSAPSGIRRGAPDAGSRRAHRGGAQGPAPAPPAGAAAVHRVRVAARRRREGLVRPGLTDRHPPSSGPGRGDNLTTGTERSPRGARSPGPRNSQVRRSSQATARTLLMLCTREGDGAWPWLPPRLQ